MRSLLERLDHLDAVRADLLLHLVVGPRARRADRPLRVATAHGRVRVDHAEVRVHAEAGDEVRVGLVVDALVDAPVVDVAVAGPDVAHRQRDLVDRILVERVELQHRNLQAVGAAEATRHGANAAPSGRLRTTVKHTTATSTARGGTRCGGIAPATRKTRDAHAKVGVREHRKREHHERIDRERTWEVEVRQGVEPALRAAAGAQPAGERVERAGGEAARVRIADPIHAGRDDRAHADRERP